MVFTVQLNILLLEEGQQNAATAVNTAWIVFDALSQLAVIDQRTAPPGGESEGDRHLVIATATGDFAGQEDDIAIRVNAAWIFKTPTEGWFCWDKALNKRLHFNGTNWVDHTAATPVTYTDSTTGTPGTTINEVTDNSETTDNVQINDNFASHHKRINDLEALLETALLMLS